MSWDRCSLAHTSFASPPAPAVTRVFIACTGTPWNHWQQQSPVAENRTRSKEPAPRITLICDERLRLWIPHRQAKAAKVQSDLAPDTKAPRSKGQREASSALQYSTPIAQALSFLLPVLVSARDHSENDVSKGVG